MVIRYDSLEKVKEHIVKYKSKIVLYGAGMIGRVVMPYIITEYGLLDNLLFYIDSDKRKQRDIIPINGRNVEVKSPECLDRLPKNTIILITNSNYSGVLNMLDSIEKLKDNTCAIIPVILAMQAKQLNRPENKKNGSQRIPKVINYCWFSRSQMPDYLEKCIESWKKYCPDYKIVRWDEDNYDVEKNLYMRQAYEAEKWGFVPDIARLDILYNHGGLYIDTDVELIKKLDDLLVLDAFAGVEKWGNINMGGCSGAIPYHPMIKKMLDYRINESFLMEDGSMNLTTCGYYETMPLIHKGFKPNNTVQTIDGMTIFSSDYFHPYDYMSGETCITENTYSIHHFNGGWLDKNNIRDRIKTKEEYDYIIKVLYKNKQENKRE